MTQSCTSLKKLNLILPIDLNISDTILRQDFRNTATQIPCFFSNEIAAHIDLARMSENTYLMILYTDSGSIFGSLNIIFNFNTMFRVYAVKFANIIGNIKAENVSKYQRSKNRVIIAFNIIVTQTNLISD